MAGPNERGAELRALMMARAADQAPTWNTPQDLSRRSFGYLFAEVQVGRELKSAGRVRLSGAGVTDSAAPAENVGAVMITLQKLIAAAGAAKRQFKGLRGALPADIQAATRLLLTAAPAPGSVVLSFAPELLPAAELSPGGAVAFTELDAPSSQLVDSAVNEVLRIIEFVHTLGPDEEGSAFLDEISDLGPRAASALREFTGALEDGRFALDIEWREPRHPARSVKLTEVDAKRIRRIVQTRKLDAQTVILQGILRTKSDVSSLHVELEPDVWTTIARGSLTAIQQQGIDLGDRVRVLAEMTIEVRPAGESNVKYTALAIEKVGED